MPAETIARLASKACRSGMATMGVRKKIPFQEVVKQGPWASEEQAAQYVQQRRHWAQLASGDDDETSEAAIAEADARVVAHGLQLSSVKPPTEAAVLAEVSSEP